jgi:hypothetical protein
MPIRTKVHRTAGLSLSIALLLATGMLFSSCTRDPFDRGRSDRRFTNQFTYETVLANSTVYNLDAVAASDGRMAMAVATGLSEVTILESTAGAWSEIKTLQGGGVSLSLVQIAPGFNSSWWVLTSNSATGIRLDRVGGAGDSTLTIPEFQSSPWDSTEGGVAEKADGRPVLYLRSAGNALVRVALADTGWAFTELPGTSGTAKIWDVSMDGIGNEHVAYQAVTDGAGQYYRVGVDSTHSSAIPGSGDYLVLAPDADGIPWIGGSLQGFNSLHIWHWDPTGAEGMQWFIETVPQEGNLYTANTGLVLASDGQPHVLYGEFRGSERFDLTWATHDVGELIYFWRLKTVIADVPRSVSVNRLQGFRLIIDAFDRPHFIFLSGIVDVNVSNLEIAIPRD